MAAQHQEVTVLWNGGWDTYVVDPGQICETPPKECEGNSRYFPTWHEGSNSGTPCWLKCCFVDGHNFGAEHESVKVIRHVDGGN